VSLSEGPKHPQSTPKTVYDPDSFPQLLVPGLSDDARLGNNLRKRQSVPGNFASSRRPFDDMMATDRPTGVGRAVARSYDDSADGDSPDDVSSASGRFRRSSQQVETLLCYCLFSILYVS